MSGKRLNFHSLRVFEDDDPDAYLIRAIDIFLDTPKGRWISEHARDLTYHIEPDQYELDTICVISGILEGNSLTEYLLRWK